MSLERWCVKEEPGYGYGQCASVKAEPIDDLVKDDSTVCGVRVKEEPGLEQHESSSACAAEEEAGGQTECGVSAAAARAGLYAGHEVKGELVLGPTALQPPDSAFAPAVTVKNEEHTGWPPVEESGPGPAGGPRPGASSLRHERLHAAETPYECTTCSGQFCGGASLAEHVLGHSGPRAACPPPPCALCGARFERREQLLRHAARHVWTPERPEVSSTDAELIGSPRAGERLRACSVRLERLPPDGRANSAILSTSVQRQTNQETKPKDAPASELYACDACGEQFARRRSLIRHIPLHSSDLHAQAPTGRAPDIVPDESCSGPTALFTARTKLSAGLVQKSQGDAGDKPLKCEFCIKQFSSKSKLVRHERIHTGEKPHKCVICLKQFTQKSNLVIHVRIHSGEKPYECNICLKRFACSSSLTTHKLVHTGEKPYKCQICLKQFTHSSSLIKHKRIHTGEKLFKCEICLKQFTQKIHLVIHVRIHSGEKPYKCKVCLKQFTRSSSLIEHKRIHTREKPYKCIICQKQFTQGNHLSRHERIHTGG